MKRFLSLALTLAMLAAGLLPAALAEDAGDAVSAAVDAAVADAEETGLEGLTVEGAETDAPVEAPADDPIEADDLSEADAVDEPAAAAEAGMAATGIRLSATSVNIGVKETYSGLTVTALPAGSALPTVTWRSDNEKIVRVDKNGAITGVKVGTANVFAKIEGGQEVSCAVNVMKGPKKLIISTSKITLGGDGMTTQLTYKMPAGVASNSFTWASSNPNVATVDQNGLVTTVGAGKATITVKAYNGKGGKCKVTVLGAPTGISFPTQTLCIAPKQTYKLEPVVTFASKKRAEAGVTLAVSPNSRDSGCISLNASTGEITGVRMGSAIITATTYNGKTATLPVTVAMAPTSISLSQSSVYIGVQNVYSGLLANLSTPTGETNVATTLVWSSSNNKIATVDQNGVITGHKKGSCVITATTVTGLKDSCKVTVFKAPKKVGISPENGTLKVGETGQYKVTFPKGSGGTVTFATSDSSIATIDDDGVVTALAVGDVTITVTAFNGKKATAKLSVRGTDELDLPDPDVDPIDSEVTEYRDDLTDAQKLSYVIYIASTQRGKPYIYGSGYKREENPAGFDCSGLVYWSFLHINIKLQDTSHKQGYDSKYKKITNVASLKRGDIVCFNTVEDGDDDLCDHTGIYLGGGKFIHASSSAKKVVISEISGYYSRTFSWGRRVLGG